jgi:hypothetical protein
VRQVVVGKVGRGRRSRPVARIAADRPLIVEQHTDHPMSRRRQEDGRGTEQDLASPENRIARGRSGEDRANAPDQLPRVHR